MIPLPLDATELEALAEDMRRGPYLLQPSVQMLSLDHEVLADLSDRVMEGQVDCKLDGRVSTRSATITLVDPAQQVAIDGQDPAAGALFYDKMIAAGVRFKGPRIGRWVHIPVITGPLSTASRAGHTAQITVQGKERLATGQVWTARTYQAGTQKVEVLRNLLEETGEAPGRIQLPGLTGRIPKDLGLDRLDTTWPSVMSLATSMNRQAMYDGRGDFRLRAWPEDPKVVLTDGTGGTILTRPEVTYDQYAGWNGVWVRGPVKKNGKRVQSTMWLPREHPLSPWSRARGGVPYRMALRVDSPKIRSQAEADEVAERHLRRLVREVVNVRVDVMPNWLLEPGDVYAIRTLALGNVEQVATEFSLPLTAGVSMSLGAVKRLQRPVRRKKTTLTSRPGATRRHSNQRREVVA